MARVEGPLEGSSVELQLVSDDGASAVGLLARASRTDVFRWTAAHGFDVAAAPGLPVDTSADGRVVTGTAGGHAFRWAEGEGTRDLGVLPGDARSVAVAASADGATVVSLSAPQAAAGAPVAWRLFKWSAALGTVPLAMPDGMSSCETRPGLTTADGATTFGRCAPDAGVRSGLFRWATGCVYPLASFDDGRTVEPQLATADGRVLAGAIVSAGSVATAFRWPEETGVVLAKGQGASSVELLGMSRDGRVIAGRLWGRAGARPVLWRGGTDTLDVLPVPPGFSAGAVRSVSDDGALVAGDVGSGASTAAAIWDEANGVRLVADLLAARGVELGGARLTSARISPDGTTLVGTATLRTPDDALWSAPLWP